MKNKQTIKNNTDYLCILKEIDISCTCNSEKCNNKRETICNSFPKK